MAGNLVLIGGAVASIMAPGGASSTPPDAREQYPVASPEFADCAELALDNGRDEAIGMRTKVAKSDSGDRLAYRMVNRWDGPLSTDEGVACRGIVNYRESIEMRSGRYAQRIDGNWFRTKTEAQAPADHVSMRIRSFVAAKQVCAIAKEFQGKTPPKVRIVRSEKRSYREAGQPAVRTENVVPMGKISCKAARK